MHNFEKQQKTTTANDKTYLACEEETHAQLITLQNSVDPEQAWQRYLDPNCLAF